MKKKELFAYIEGVECMLLNLRDCFKKLENENINMRVQLSMLSHEMENFRPKPPLGTEGETRFWSEQELVVPDIQEAMRRERMKQVITADSFDSYVERKVR